MGIVAAIPVGPILIMVIQRTLCSGRRAGLMTGVGSALADALYAAAALFALSLVGGFLEENQAWLLLGGAVIIGFVGVGIIRRRVSLEADKSSSSSLPPLKFALQSFGSVLTNPAALAVMMALLAFFKLDAASSAPAWLLVLGVGAGELLYWTLITGLLSKYLKFNEKTLRVLSLVMGWAVCAFALVLLVRSLIILI